MAQEISLSLFERNAKIFNRKGLRRTFSSIYTHSNEYVPVVPLSARKEVVLEVTLDKNSADTYQQFLKDNGFIVLGDKNFFHLENAVKDFDQNPTPYQQQKEAIDKVRTDVDNLKKDVKPYNEVKDEDVIFYFLPYNDVVKTLFEFIGAYKDKISEFAKKEDITIMMKISGYCNQIDGFFGFNFFDADQGDKEVVVDYASKINVKVDFRDRFQVFAAGTLLAGVGDDLEELSAMNTSIIAENLKYTQE
jgi:hypothetical protein